MRDDVQHPETEGKHPPWWDKLIPVYYALGGFAGYLVWTFFSPPGYAGLWPVAAVGGGFVAAVVLIIIMGDDRYD